MKTKSTMLAVVVMLFSISTLFASDVKTEKIKVYGNCGMCKTRIEKAANSVKGVTSASWNSDDALLTVTFDASKTTTLKVEEAVSKVGHDTDHTRAADKTYNGLPGCCQYDRPAKK